MSMRRAYGFIPSNLLYELKNLGVSIKHENHEVIYSARKVKVDCSTGEIVEELVTV